MTMPPRFSPDELLDIIDGTRLRSPVMRDKGPDHDSIDLLIPHMPGCSYRFARDRTGWTYLIYTAADEFKLMASGTLGECLGVFAARSVP